MAGRQVTSLTLARAAGAVVAPKGVSPPGQAHRTASFFCLATGATQPPEDEVLDALDCGSGQEEGVTLQRGLLHPLTHLA